MNPIQAKLLDLAQKHDLSTLGLREIGRMIGEVHPQTVKYHLNKLNLIGPNKVVGVQQKSKSNLKGGLLNIPVYGLANCGEALIHAEPHLEGHIGVSKTLLGNHFSSNLFAVQAVGNSMNKADVKGRNIEPRDYIVVDPEDRNFKDGDYVLSSINGLANVKKLRKDDNNKQVVLIAESNDHYPPMYIHEDDFEHYIANGKVVAVFKQPKVIEDDIRFEQVSQIA